MAILNKSLSLHEVASIVSTTLEEAGISAVLTGGAAVSIYTDNLYQSYDLDFISPENNKKLEDALRPLGFSHRPGYKDFTCPDTDFSIEFPGRALVLGDMVLPLEDTNTLETPFGILRVVTPTQSIIDRMAAYVYWKDPQSQDQALLIAQKNEIDWTTLYSWAASEGIKRSIIDDLKSSSENLRDQHAER